jgi:hypothetical protein
VNDGDGARRNRSSSFSKAADTFDFPVPSAMITVEAQRDNLVVKASSQSVLGAISTLTKAKIGRFTTFLDGIGAHQRTYWVLKRSECKI